MVSQKKKKRMYQICFILLDYCSEFPEKQTGRLFSERESFIIWSWRMWSWRFTNPHSCSWQAADVGEPYYCSSWGASRSPGGAGGKEPNCHWGDIRDMSWTLGLQYPLKEGMAPPPVFLPAESHGQRSLAGYSPLVAESDRTEVT